MGHTLLFCIRNRESSVLNYIDDNLINTDVMFYACEMRIIIFRKPSNLLAALQRLPKLGTGNFRYRTINYRFSKKINFLDKVKYIPVAIYDHE